MTKETENVNYEGIRFPDDDAQEQLNQVAESRDFKSKKWYTMTTARMYSDREIFPNEMNSGVSIEWDGTWGGSYTLYNHEQTVGNSLLKLAKEITNVLVPERFYDDIKNIEIGRLGSKPHELLLLTAADYDIYVPEYENLEKELFSHVAAFIFALKITKSDDLSQVPFYMVSLGKYIMEHKTKGKLTAKSYFTFVALFLYDGDFPIGEESHEVFLSRYLNAYANFINIFGQRGKNEDLPYVGGNDNLPSETNTPIDYSLLSKEEVVSSEAPICFFADQDLPILGIAHEINCDGYTYYFKYAVVDTDWLITKFNDKGLSDSKFNRYLSNYKNPKFATDGIVISHTSTVLNLRKAYKSAKADDYKKHLKYHTINWGKDNKESIDDLNKPILVKLINVVVDEKGGGMLEGISAAKFLLERIREV